MKALVYLRYPFLIVLTSFFFFPFEFTFFPGINTKMAMAALGLVVFFINAINRKASVDKDFFISTIFAALVSLFGLISVVINDTTDFSYASYIVSFFVWMGAAYFLITCIKVLHGHINQEIVLNYLIAVCVAQCIIAVLISRYPSLKNFVDSFLAGEGFMGKVDSRMYGIGAALDVAGEKFGCILVAISFLIVNKDNMTILQAILYWTSFIAVAIIGNLIGRTTTVGLALAIVYLIFVILNRRTRIIISLSNSRLVSMFLLFAITIPLLIHLYNNNPNVRADLRFGFEGFFSLFEKGRWETNSNNRLVDLVILPDNTKTWIIGDGYFDNPYSDPNYIGENPTEFYKGTDVGYLRFIFYFGLVGMMAFVFFMAIICWRCINRHRKYAVLLLLLLLLNYIVWVKVASDIFLIFALFLCVASDDRKEDNAIEPDEQEL